MSFTLEYLSTYVDFTSISYAGIEYYLDGELKFTTSDTINLLINDYDSHNFSMMFGGIKHEYIFSTDID